MSATVIISGEIVPLRWDKGAMFRADELGLFDKRKPGIGLAAGAKYIWVMAPEAIRERFATPSALAEVMPPLKDAWAAINQAVDEGKDRTDAKNVFGSTSGHSPASS